MDNTPERISTLEKENSILQATINSLQEYQNERDALQKAYNESQVRFRTIFEESSLGNKIINEELNIIQINKSLIDILGYNEEELVGRKIIEYTHPDYVQGWEKLRKELWSKENARTSFSIDTCLIRKDKSTIWCHVSSIIFHDNGDRLGYTIIEDITDRKEAQRIKDELLKRDHLLELKIQEQKKQQELFHATIRAQEEERERIAEQLHNSLGQLLYAAKLNLDQIKPGEDREINEINRKQLSKTEGLIADCITECRRTSHGLLPMILKDYGLRAAIADLCEQLNPGLNIKWQFNSSHAIKDKYVEVVIFRTVQELLLNVVKHAAATKAFCKVDISKSRISLSVEDNGKGFDPGKIEGRGIGLTALKGRIELMGGTLNISSNVNGGTVISIQLPRGVSKE
ncbi:PAS domain-containing sensor histidine kinase [Desertivirga arenae]|uniref:PAS domain-containing sensor histidine kinase n=1 Tax=Desertivirga arenae TaxID=2810309 RepID=UPI001A968752|nr:PAS domain-containing sensor histidine kinase [Pedobacter sp. SYSU D00823]